MPSLIKQKTKTKHIHFLYFPLKFCTTMVKCAIIWGILAMLFQTLIPRIYNLTSGLVWVWAHLVGVNVLFVRNGFPRVTPIPQQICVHEASQCVLLVLEIFCSSTKINFRVDVEPMGCFLCVFSCFICISFKIMHINIGFTLILYCYQAHCELKTVSNQHIVNMKIS